MSASYVSIYCSKVPQVCLKVWRWDTIIGAAHRHWLLSITPPVWYTWRHFIPPDPASVGWSGPRFCRLPEFGCCKTCNARRHDRAAPMSQEPILWNQSETGDRDRCNLYISCDTWLTHEMRFDRRNSRVNGTSLLRSTVLIQDSNFSFKSAACPTETPSQHIQHCSASTAACQIEQRPDQYLM